MSGERKFDASLHTVYQGRVFKREAAMRGDFSESEPTGNYSFGEGSPWTAQRIAARAEAWRAAQAAKGFYISDLEAVRHVTG